ncbi:hypothetical protein [Cupriavidus sp. SK-3]|nr:hypothetical protein [Cupriavidus sp. SK-3]
MKEMLKNWRAWLPDALEAFGHCCIAVARFLRGSQKRNKAHGPSFA